MILIQVPYRVSLFGGGTDYPTWFMEHGGSVLGMAINRYCYVGLKRLLPFYDDGVRYRIVYAQTENTQSIEEIKHPAVRAVLRHFNVEEGLELFHAGDLPARSGLGSSSAFVVGMIHALHFYYGEEFTAQGGAALATWIEQNVIKEAVGNQDQMFAAHGGVLHVEFDTTNAPTVNRLELHPSRLSELEHALIMVYTGTLRDAPVMAAAQLAEQHQHQSDLSMLSSFAREASRFLSRDDVSLDIIGHMLHEAWLCKRRLAAGVSNEDIDALYARGRLLGALGGKLLGAGGGGFILFYVPHEKQRRFMAEIGAPCLHVRMSPTGSRVLINQP